MGTYIAAIKCRNSPLFQFYMYLKFFIGHGFCTDDFALKLNNGGYKITGRLNDAIRFQGVWLNIAEVENQMVAPNYYIQ